MELFSQQAEGKLVSLSLAEGEDLTGERAEAVIAANADAQVVLSDAQGRTVILPPGTVEREADLQSLLPALPEKLEPGQTVIRVDGEGNRTPVILSLVEEGKVLFVAEKGCTYEIEEAATDFTDLKKTRWSRAGVDFASARGLMKGTGNGAFSPKDKANRAAVVTTLSRLMGEEPQPEKGKPWHAPYMEWSVEAGLTDGTEPKAKVTRQELVTMLWKCAGTPEVFGDTPEFTDAGSVAEDARVAVEWAASNGILKGKTGAEGAYIDPEGLVSREELAVFLQRFVACLLEEQTTRPVPKKIVTKK